MSSQCYIIRLGFVASGPGDSQLVNVWLRSQWTFFRLLRCIWVVFYLTLNLSVLYHVYIFQYAIFLNILATQSKRYTVCLQKNGAVSKVNKKFISHLTRAQRTPSAAATVQVSHALPAVRFSCLLRGRGASLQDGVTAGKGFLCAPF